jgi:hypothetical protein
METVNIIIEITLGVLLLLNILKEFYWSKKQKEYYKDTSASAVFS